MSLASKTAVGLGLLSLLLLAAWFAQSRVGTTGSPTADERMHRLLADVRAERPWYHGFLERTKLVRFLPAKWATRIRYSEMDLSSRGYRAAKELGLMGTNAWPAVPSLLRMVNYKNISVGLRAAEALVGIKAEEHPDWRELQKGLADQSRAAKVFHYLVLAFDYSTVKRYDFTHRRFGLIGLAATGPAANWAYADMLEIVKFDSEPELRALAVIVIGNIPEKKLEALPLLKQILQDKEEWPKVSGSAAQALATAAPQDPETRDLLRQALQDPRALVRLAAASALWRLKTPADEVLPTLAALLKHKLATVRTGALNEVAEMAGSARSTRAEVERLTTDETESVRTSALKALKNIDAGT